MNKQQIKAMELALEALENSVDLVVENAYNAEQLYGKYQTRQGKVNGLKVLADQHKEAIAAIKEALAQPEQEPLEYWNAVEGWVKIDEVREHFDSVGCGTIYKSAGEGRAPLYTTPPQRTAAEGEDIQRAWVNASTWRGLTDEEIEDCYKQGGIGRAAQMLKEKNT